MPKEDNHLPPKNPMLARRKLGMVAFSGLASIIER